MKKYFVALLLVGVVTFGAHTAGAYTLTDLYNQIASLTKEVTSLKANLNLGAAAVTSTYSTTYGTTVLPTMPTIPISEPVNPTSDIDWKKLCLDKKPHIQVLSPNGGETYQAGQKIDVKWRSCNYNGNVISILAYYDSNSSTHSWASRLSDFGGTSVMMGKESVIIPTYLSEPSYTGKHYKVYVLKEEGMSPIHHSSIKDSSDNLFSITGATTVPVPVNSCRGLSVDNYAEVVYDSTAPLFVNNGGASGYTNPFIKSGDTIIAPFAVHNAACYL